MGDVGEARIGAMPSCAIEAKEGITLVGLPALLDGRRMPIEIDTLWRFFDQHRIMRNKLVHATERDRPDVLRRRDKCLDGHLDRLTVVGNGCGLRI